MTTFVCRHVRLIGLACAGFAFSQGARAKTGATNSEFTEFPWDGSKTLDSGAKDEPSLVTNMRGDWGAFVGAWNSLPQQCIESGWQRLVSSSLSKAGDSFAKKFRVYGVTKKVTTTKVRNRAGKVEGEFTDYTFSPDMLKTGEHFRLNLAKPLEALLSDIEAGRVNAMSPPSAACKAALKTALTSVKAIQKRVNSQGDVDTPAGEADLGREHSWAAYTNVSPRSLAMQHLTDKLVHDFEGARVMAIDLQCSESFRGKFEEAMRSYPEIRAKSGSPLGDAPLRSQIDDLERVERAQAALKPFVTNDDGRCAAFMSRASNALDRLQEHLAKEREGLKSNSAVYEALVERGYRETPSDACEVLVVDSSASTSYIVEKNGQRMSRSEYLKMKALEQLARLPSNVGGRSGLVVFGQRGLDLYASHGCAQVAATVPLGPTSQNRAAMEAGISKIKPSDDSPVSAGIVEAAIQTNGCKGERIIDVAWDFDMGGTDGCSKQFCQAVAHLWNRGIRVKLRFVPIRNTAQKSQSFLSEVECVKAFTKGVEITDDSNLFGQMFTAEATPKLLTSKSTDGDHAVAGKLVGNGSHRAQTLASGQILNAKDGKFSNGKTVGGTRYDDPEGPQSQVETLEAVKGDLAQDPASNAAPSISNSAPSFTPVVKGHEMDAVGELEKRFVSRVRSEISPEERVEKLEQMVFGEKKEGALFDRVKRLQDVLPGGKAAEFNPDAPVSAPDVAAHGGPKSMEDAMPPLAPNYTPAAASGVSSAPKPDPVSAEAQDETEKVLRQGIYHGTAIDPATGKTKACTVAVTYSGQWNFDPHMRMVQVNAWFDSDVNPAGTRLEGKTWSVAFGQPDDYSKNQPTLSYEPKISDLKSLKVPVPVLSEKSIQKQGLKITGRQIGYRFAAEHPDEPMVRQLQGGYQLSRIVKKDDRLKLVEKSFDLKASMDRDCNLSEIKISVQNKDLPGSGSFDKEDYDAWKRQPKSFTTDHTMSCKITKRENDPKKTAQLPPHIDRCQSSTSSVLDDAIH